MIKSAVITRKTDDKKVTYGYCWRCGTYLELWKKDNKSICWRCDRKLLHIPSWIITIIILAFIFLVLLAL